MAVLEIKDLYKAYGSVQAINGLNMTVEKGSVFGFIGQNGSGKTTTLRMITGLAKPDKGDIFVNGERVNFGKLSTNKYIGFLPDVPEMYGYLTPNEYLMLCGRLYGLNSVDIKKESERLLELVGLKAANRKIKGFSRGMKQRLGIAQALIHHPSLLLLDEPTSALDPIGRREVLDIIKALRGSITVMFSTHILSDAQDVCDSIGVLEKGKLVLNDSMANINQRYGTNTIKISIVQEDSLQAVADRLQAAHLASSIKIAEDKSMVINCPDSTKIYESICPILSQMNIHLKSFTTEQIKLEDVFMEVIGQ